MGILDYSTTPSDNASINGIGIVGTNKVLNFDNAIRQVLADIAAALIAGTFSGAGYVAKSGGYTVLTTDRGKVIDCTASLELDLPVAATAAAGFMFWVKANGGAVTLDPNGSENINGASASQVVPSGSTVMVVCDGTGWHTGFNGLATLLAPAFLDSMSVASASAGTLFTLESTENGSTVGPAIDLYRNSPSPLASDTIGGLFFSGEDSLGNKRTYAAIPAVIIDPTNGGEDARLSFFTIVAGSLASRLNVDAGVYTPGASGGDKGADTINASQIYVGGIPVPQLQATLVGTLTTTSGTTQSLTGIATTYRALLLLVNGVGGDGLASFRIALSSNNGSSYGTPRTIVAGDSASGTGSGWVMILNTGASPANKIILPATVTTNSGEIQLAASIESSITGLINAVQASPSTGNFDAGTIAVYGIS